MDIVEGRQYRFKTGDRVVCQVLRIAPGAIPVWRGVADLTIGIVTGRNRGMVLPFGTLARFTECVEPV